MSRRLSFFLKTTTLGFTAWTLVFTREVPTAVAQAPIETDCSTELDQPDTTYLLNTNVAGDCVIAADNIILDGQNMYEVSGNVMGTTTSYTNATNNFTVQNVTVGGNVNNYIGSSSYYDAGDVTVIDSEVSGNVYSGTYYGGVGSVTIQNSTVENVSVNGDGDGDITITDSTINGEVTQNGISGPVTITDSTINSTNSYAIQGRGPVTVNNSTINHSSGYYYSVFSNDNIEITNSIINTDAPVSIYGDDCVVTDTTFTEDNVYCSTLTLTDAAPSLTVTPLTLELEKGDTFNPFENVSADDIVDGDLSGDVIVVGEVGEGPGTYELVYSVTDLGTTLLNNFDDSTATSGPSTASLTRTVIRPEGGY